MFGLFKPRPPVGADEFDWLLACFAWLLRELDGDDPAMLTATGVLGPATMFDGIDRSLRGHALAEALFARVMQGCRMNGWQGELIPGEIRRENAIQPGFALKHDRSPPLGLFRVDGGKVSIAYDPALLATPDRLVATLAHELAHYLLVGRGEPPGGPDLIEHATDCAAAYLGFGVFLANSALNFRQFTEFDQQGWEMQAAGYLSEPALVTATAIAAHLAGTDAERVAVTLKSHLRRPFARALAATRARLPDGVNSLRAIEVADWA